MVVGLVLFSWLVGRVLGQSFGVLLDHLVDCLVAWLVGWSVAQSYNRLDDRSVGVLLDGGWDGWLVGLLDGEWIGWSVSWLEGWLLWVRCLVNRSTGY